MYSLRVIKWDIFENYGRIFLQIFGHATFIKPGLETYFFSNSQTFASGFN